MHGGLGFGKFFIDEVNRIEEQHRKNLPESHYTPEETEAGFPALAKSFGVYATLLYLEKETPFTRKELEQMTTYEIYHNLRYLAWHARTVKKYGEIMDRKSEAESKHKRR